MKNRIKKEKVVILGAGITGLSAGYIGGFPIYEAKDIAGGICTSYYIRKNSKERLYEIPRDGEAYHFEIGGGHWVFGGDPTVVHFIDRHAPCKRYTRKASIFFPDENTFVPYPIQNNLFHLGKETARKAAQEMMSGTKDKVLTMEKWLEINFGKTLCKKFFHPFHELYTAGLYKKIIPQDAHKSPINHAEVLNGLKGKAAAAGYNTTFIYPEKGLDFLMRKLAKVCKINFGKRAQKIDIERKIISFSDSTKVEYDNIISTLPLNRMVEIAGIRSSEDPHPSPAVLVVNIGAKKGPKCPEDHWIYLPKTNAGFHRVGFYSNVDPLFLPKSHREKNDRVSIYVEKAYPEGTKHSNATIDDFCKKVICELKDWGWIKDVETYDPTWIDTAYTWSWPDSKWRENSLHELGKNDIYQIGRYGRWVFQGVADSIKDGLMIGGAFTDK